VFVFFISILMMLILFRSMPWPKQNF